MADEAKTLEELILIFGDVTSFMDDFAQDIVTRNPGVVGEHEDGTTSFLLGRIVAIGIMNFLTNAYGRSELGYVPADPQV